MGHDGKRCSKILGSVADFVLDESGSVYKIPHSLPPSLFDVSDRSMNLLSNAMCYLRGNNRQASH